MKLTENDVVNLLADFLKNTGWEIEKICLNNERGNDIEAKKNGQKLIVEAKGAKANDNAFTKKREKFDGGQIKDHFGKAIVKILEEKEKNKNSNTKFAIAHPNDSDIKKHIGHLISYLNKLGITHYWIGKDGDVIED